MKMRLFSFVTAAFALVTLAGCGGPESSDLGQWMKEQRSQPGPKIAPLAAPVPYVPLPYTQSQSVDPFSVERLMRGIASSDTGRPDSSLFDERSKHRKEPLEGYPLDTMTMVGSLDRAGNKVALVRVNKLLYQVRVGNYLGQNLGLVENISENEVTLSEVVQDGTGGWIKRPATLQLQEKTK